MLPEENRKELERQGYRIVGAHSAVKACGWTKNMIRGTGGCYKFKFYGIMSHQCLQMTTSMSCANRCTFCWRGYKAPVNKEWKGEVDEPEFIIAESEKAHHKLLVGFKGHAKASKQIFAQSNTIKHVALSLTGEPITYPRINEIIAQFHCKGISTFLVTNATYPKEIAKLAPITQLYLSIDAPNKELLKKVDVPLFVDFWERMNESLEYLAKKRHRTAIRLTIVKGVNDVEPEGYARLIEKGSPDFVEIKGYMHVGASRQRLSREHMPTHDEVAAFARKVEQHLPDWEMVSEHRPSDVVMLAKRKFLRNGIWHTWIDFEKFHALATKSDDFATEDYLMETPASSLMHIDERTRELEFYTTTDENS